MSSRGVRLSIVIPAYQAEATIENTLRSALDVAGADTELVVIDDGSTDGTRYAANAVAAGDSRVRVICQKNRGRSAARNRGVRAARGEWLMFLDADDRLAPTSGGLITTALSDQGHDLVVFGMRRSDGLDGLNRNVALPRPADCRPFELPAGKVSRAMVDGNVEGLTPLAGLFEWNSCWSRLYRRKRVLAMTAAMGMEDWAPFPTGLKFSEDRLFNVIYLKFLGDGRVSFVPQILYLWDLGNSGTVEKVSSRDVRELESFSEAVGELVDANVLRRDESEKLLAGEVMLHVRRSGRIPLRLLPETRREWKGVLTEASIDKSVFREAISSCRGRSRAYVPALRMVERSRISTFLFYMRLIDSAKSLARVFCSDKGIGGDVR